MRPLILGWKRWLPGVLTLAVAGGLAVRQCGGPAATETPSARQKPVAQVGQPVAGPATDGPDFAEWSAGFSQQQAPPAELRAQPEAHTGTLGNGLRHVVMPDPSDGGLSLRLVVMAGSLHEAEAEQGLAHWVEHMAFRGTAGRAGESALNAFERLGLSPGADSNGTTSCDHTVFRLDLPEASDEAVEAALRFFRKVAGGLEFPGEEVEAERLVMLREFDERQGAGGFAHRAAVLLPQARAGRRPPIGKREVLERATPAMVARFWQRQYVPEKMVVVAVGDCDPAVMRKQIETHFGTLSARAAPAEPEPGDPMADWHRAAAVLPESGAIKLTRITLAVVHPLDLRPDGPLFRREILARTVAMILLENRLNRRFGEADVGGIRPVSNAVEVVRGIGWVEVSAVCDRTWGRPLQELLLETRRALRHGFTALEYAEALGKTRQAVRDRFASRLVAAASTLADEMVQAVVMGRCVESPEDELNRTLTDLAGLDPAEVMAVLRDDWSRSELRVVVSGVVSADQESAVAAVVRQVPEDPSALPESNAAPRSWTPATPAGNAQVVRCEHDPVRGVMEAEFSNRVVLRMAPMPGLGGQVEIRVQVGSGRLAAPADCPAVTLAAGLFAKWYPVAEWRELDLHAALAGEDVSWEFTMADSAFEWAGSTTRGALRRQLEVMRELVTHSGLATVDRERRIPESVLSAYRLAVQQGGIGLELRRQAAGLDPRFEWLPAGMEEVTAGQAADWLLPILKDDRLGVFIAGDFDPAQVLAEVGAAFGTLPMREPWNRPQPGPPVPETEPGVHELALTNERNLGHAAVMLPAQSPLTATAELQLGLLKNLLRVRLRAVMREQNGWSYSPQAFRMQAPGDDREWLVGSVPCEPGRVDEVADALRGVAADLAAGHWTADEFRRAARPLPFTIRKDRRNPRHLVAALQHPERIAAPAQLEPAVVAKLENPMRDRAKKVCDPATTVELRLRPDPDDRPWERQAPAWRVK